VGRPAQPTDVPAEAEILARGLAAFAELGYDGASVRELARRLGVSHNFINDRYGSKELFWRAVIDRSLVAQVARLGAVLNVSGEDDQARLRNLVHAFHQANVAEPDLSRILQYESIRGGARLEYVPSTYAPVSSVMAGCARGTWRASRSATSKGVSLARVLSVPDQRPSFTSSAYGR